MVKAAGTDGWLQNSAAGHSPQGGRLGDPIWGCAGGPGSGGRVPGAQMHYSPAGATQWRPLLFGSRPRPHASLCGWAASPQPARRLAAARLRTQAAAASPPHMTADDEGPRQPSEPGCRGAVPPRADAPTCTDVQTGGRAACHVRMCADQGVCEGRASRQAGMRMWGRQWQRQCRGLLDSSAYRRRHTGRAGRRPASGGVQARGWRFEPRCAGRWPPGH